MDPTNIDNGIAAISLDNEDEDGLVFGDEIGDSSIQQPAYDFCLVGRFLTERPVNFVAMKNTMASLWRPEEGMVVKEVGAGLYIFQFGALAEMERVMEMCPWSFNNQALLLERLGRSQDPSEVSLHHLYVWVRVYGLKRGFFSERVAQRLGNEIGQFVEADPKNFSNPWSSYLRIRVKLDVQKPLKKGTRLKREGEEWFHVDFAYERLPTFCFVCGRLGHGERFCPETLQQWGRQVWKGVRRSPLEVWTRTYRDYEDWWRMATPRNSTTTNLRAEPGATKGWERPPVNYLKVNVDASSGLVDRYVGLGFIVRDYEG
ncbi:unnamed protein product [Cuscuta campestris]|uniref:CCHC-type domain-containing protein n=1 Tax=Cuscuta campestris TaxID=132261 RepID=A0A484KMQ3_9ASTE|nr:unnamed protein product [Cuscuta campestris]